MSDSSTNAGYLSVPPDVSVTYTALKAQLFMEAPRAADAVQFYKDAFGAEEMHRDVQNKRFDLDQPLLYSIELKIGGCSFLVTDITDDSPASVKDGVGVRNVIYLETEDVEAALGKAITAGAIPVGKVSLAECVGLGKYSKVMMKDPYGNVWIICLYYVGSRAIIFE